MRVNEPDYTEDDIKKLIEKPRFLAAVYAYSQNLLPLGEAVDRAADSKPLPEGLQLGTYYQIIQDVAERIESGKIQIDRDLTSVYPDVYSQPIHQSSYDPGKRYFSELKDPKTKQKVFQLYQKTYNEEDLQFFLNDRNALSIINSYGLCEITFLELKAMIFGDVYAHPRDLSWGAFWCLCYEIIRKLQSGEVAINSSITDSVG